MHWWPKQPKLVIDLLSFGYNSFGKYALPVKKKLGLVLLETMPVVDRQESVGIIWFFVQISWQLFDKYDIHNSAASKLYWV